jgi:hypothetical protein
MKIPSIQEEKEGWKLCLLKMEPNVGWFVGSKIGLGF